MLMGVGLNDFDVYRESVIQGEGQREGSALELLRGQMNLREWSSADHAACDDRDQAQKLLDEATKRVIRRTRL